MNRPPNAQLTHFGFFCQNLDAMVEFYTRTFGLVLTDRGDYYLGGEIAFLSRNPQEHHQIVLASGRPNELNFNPINQISFRVDDLAALRTYHSNLLRDNVPLQRTITHGNAWSIYLFDPEGNRIELYTPSPWYIEQPFGVPIDLTLSEAEILAQTEKLIHDDPTRVNIQEWSQGLKAKLFN
jgi:catechol 2,3-dioxygenase-like lactoylglutathione lyase family enzyme